MDKPHSVRTPLHTGAPAPMNPTQVRTFNELLAVGAERPHAPVGLVEELHDILRQGTAKALGSWTEKTMFFSKAQLTRASGCEALMVAQREAEHTKPATLHPKTAAGLVAHRAIQLSYTHSSMSPTELVNASVDGCKAEDRFSTFFEEAFPAVQSDVIVMATSTVTGFLDSWPSLHPSWAPRFEEQVQARVGDLILSARVDLLMGRPRADGRQTMLISDWKSSGINDSHYDEAQFYALVSALRFGVPPFRSTVFSLASGEWTDPEVTAASLRSVADKVVAAVNATVDVFTDSRPVVHRPSRSCSWCPLATSCEAFAEHVAAGAPKLVGAPAA